VARAYFLRKPEQAAAVSILVQTLDSVLVSLYAAHVADVAGAFSVGSGLQSDATAALNSTCSARPITAATSIRAPQAIK
jgi:hypothetical protein